VNNSLIGERFRLSARSVPWTALRNDRKFARLAGGLWKKRGALAVGACIGDHAPGFEI
jgi:uncharacterized protein YbaA (DUF1428 family)